MRIAGLLSVLCLSGSPVAAQELSSQRPDFGDNAVVVAYADEEVATAVGGILDLTSGGKRTHAYTVYRKGTAESEWSTPAYSIGVVDFDCSGRAARQFTTSFYRGNGDPILTGDETPEFAPITDEDPLLLGRFHAVCSSDERPVYGDFFLFMDAYGLNDGRAMRNPPGPMVR